MSTRHTEVESLISQVKNYASARYAEHSDSYMAGLLESMLTNAMVEMNEEQYAHTATILVNLNKNNS